MAKCSFRKTKTGFSYSGTLEDCLISARHKLERLEKETPYIERRFKEEKQRHDRHDNAIYDTKRFIWCVEDELKKIRENKVKGTETK